MRISWNWLQRYLDRDLDPHAAAAILTSTGLEVEHVALHEPVKGMLKGVVVGQVLTCRKHPDADRLSLCTVDIGSGDPTQIVCGAPNVAAGQKVMVATVGADLCMTDGTCILIKKTKIRGQESNGMICAEDELGLGNDHDGILVLDPAAVVGTPAAQQLGLRADHVMEIGLTPNRTDAMGHIGVARDLVAALNYRTGAGVKLVWPAVDAFARDAEEKEVSVEVLAPGACPRYAGVTLAGITVAPSPAWLQEALTSIGLKPINNVVDVTNFVQHETGQPLHAFDADTLKDGRIVVRMAAPNEPFTTLDEKERTLNEADLVIADASAPACIAGVFGGAKSGVTTTTRRVFLESACFDPSTIRRTARRHGLNTDASFRFERGVDPEITLYALKRAALLLKEVAGARVVSGITDIDARDDRANGIELRFAEVDRLTGISIPPDRIVQALELLDCTVSDRSAGSVHVKVPAYRVDVTRPVDLVEEVLRIHGFDEVPVPDRLLTPPVRQASLTDESFRERIGAHLVASGFREIMTPSLVNGERTVKSGVIASGDLVRLRNPLSAELDVMRPTLLFGALQTIAHNINRQQRDLRMFERGRTYRVGAALAEETDRLALAVTGRHSRERWRSTDRKAGLADLKAEAEALLERMGIDGEWVPVAHATLQQAFELKVSGRTAGVIGEVTKAMLREYDVNQPVYFAEFDGAVLLEACLKGSITYHELPRFPAVRRDLSVLLDSKVGFAELRRAAFKAERKLLRSMDLFDVYEGDKLPAGKKSYAMSFILQDAEATLTDAQVEKAMQRIQHAFAKEVGAQLRG